MIARKCPTGKRRYKDRIAALLAVESANRRKHERREKNEQRAYACPFCHWYHVTSQPKRLPAQSPKRAKEQQARAKMLRETFGTQPTCVVPGCLQYADDAHEPLTRARGGSITDPNNVVPVCRTHHDLLTFAPESQLGWAYEAGLLRHSWEDAS